ncbi:acyl-CoA dehydrogenase family protein (plasmid) [Streptomyces chartreusis]|uniref:acyl-CoA dehydrogenase family protein n=1 Tax=Streptomyces chartreusis TaxID=1969 RepID=UPI002F90C5FA|nr:acyl-CoA dehydrogenase family protein [Streptomyces chartreusis]
MTDVRSATSLLEELNCGRPAWSLLADFPEQGKGDAEIGNAAVHEATAAMQKLVDVPEVERTRSLPINWVKPLQDARLYGLTTPVSRGGRGLSPYNAYRVICAIAQHSVPPAVSIAVHTGFGASAYLPLLPEGPLRDAVAAADAAQVISGDADTEPTGAANRRRMTTARLDEQGTHYVLDGHKVYIQNAPVAGLLRVSATIVGGEDDGRVGLFFVPTDLPGITVGEPHRFVGLRGVPNAPLSFAAVQVPREFRFVIGSALGTEQEWRLQDQLNDVSVRARMYAIAAPAAALTALCQEITREFLRGRRVDGADLSAYGEIQSIVALNAADMMAQESVARWCLLSQGDPAHVRREQMAAKNITSVTCWRVVERTMSLLAAHGLETDEGLTLRGLPGHGLERIWRDARMLRISGGVDFFVDHFYAMSTVFGPWYEGSVPNQPGVSPEAAPPEGLSERNERHWAEVGERSAWFADCCRTLVAAHPRRVDLERRQDLTIAAGRFSSELLAAALVLGQAATSASEEHQLAADVYCTAASTRMTGLAHELSHRHDTEAAAALSRIALAGE